MNTRTLTKAAFGKRFAILVGTFSGGFALHCVQIGRDAAQDCADKLLADGQLAEAVPVMWPSDVDSSIDDAEHMKGLKYLVLADEGIGPNLRICGPFVEDEFSILDEVGENFRPEDGAYGELEDLSGVNMFDLLNAVLNTLVDKVVEELKQAWPLVSLDPAIVAAFKQLVPYHFTAKEDSQMAFEAVLHFIEGQIMVATTVEVILSQIRSYDSGVNTPELVQI